MLTAFIVGCVAKESESRNETPTRLLRALVRMLSGVIFINNLAEMGGGSNVLPGRVCNLVKDISRSGASYQPTRIEPTRFTDPR